MGLSLTCDVEAGDHFAVGGAYCVPFFGELGDLAGEVDDGLFQTGDAVFESLDVVGCAEAGLAPCLVSEVFRELLLQVADSCVQAPGAFLGVGQVGLQGGSGYQGAGVVAGGLGAGGVDLLVRVARDFGKRVHVGRINSLKRLRYADYLGADTVDGTYLTRAPDRLLPNVLDWTKELRSLVPLPTL